MMILSGKKKKVERKNGTLTVYNGFRPVHVSRNFVLVLYTITYCTCGLMLVY